jgi:hypothetical protein
MLRLGTTRDSRALLGQMTPVDKMAAHGKEAKEWLVSTAAETEKARKSAADAQNTTIQAGGRTRARSASRTNGSRWRSGVPS